MGKLVSKHTRATRHSKRNLPSATLPRPANTCPEKFHDTQKSPSSVTPSSSYNKPKINNNNNSKMQKEKTHVLDEPVESYLIPGAKVFDRYFECPLSYKIKSTETITVFVRHLVPIDKTNEMKTMPFLLYLQGGPGFEVGLPKNVTSGWMKEAFKLGYQILLLDQRGTGHSTPISAELMNNLGLNSDQAKAGYLTFFRADSIVRDCETIRKRLVKGRALKEDRCITLLGQSFGGFCITTYLSLFPESIDQAFITGGVPPLVNSPDDVYRALYPRILSRNKLYYKKYPKDIERVREIHAYLSKNTVTVPNGGTLSPRRFLQLGILFGGAGGYDTLHETIILAHGDLERLSHLSYRTLNHIQELQRWDSNVLYAVLHEAIYCQNERSNWSAERVREESAFAVDFEWRHQHIKPDQVIHFTGETIHPFMFDDYAELKPLKNAAHLLAENVWGELYDKKALNANTALVAGISYYDDMYVDRELSVKAAAEIGGFQQWITNEYAHNGLHEDGERIFNHLVKLVKEGHAYDR